MAERIELLDHAPVIGEKYLVRCLENDEEPFKPQWGWTHGTWIPCIGYIHNDKEYGFGDFSHAHYDYRFLNDLQMLYFIGRMSDEDYADQSPLLWAMTPPDPPSFKWIELTCYRQMPIHKVRSCGFMLHTLQPAFKDHVVDIRNPICPHRHVCLKNLPTRKGVVVCPAHGLHFDMKTGKMVEKKIADWMIP